MFKRLLTEISDPLDVKHAIHAAELYQIKGQDFSTEINSVFISACLRANSPEAVIKHFSVRKNRLSSWTPPVSLNRLLEALLEKDTLPEEFLEVLKLMRLKGCFVSGDVTVDLLHKIVEKHGDDEFKEALKSIISEIKGV
jgi:benzoyl-CoA reductase/2-hydroxyglutaryl-CoA dehydratase subunit BcrC/BadD/HgdB